MKLTSILLNRQGKKSRDSRAFIYAVVLPLASVLFASTALSGANVAGLSDSQVRTQQISALQERQRKLLEFLLQDWQLDDPPGESVEFFQDNRPSSPSLAVVFGCPELPDSVGLDGVFLSNYLNHAVEERLSFPGTPRRGPPCA